MSELVGVFPPSVDQDPLRRALDCLQEGFQIIGYDWHYIYVNPAAARHGRILGPSGLAGPYAVFGPAGDLIGVYEDEGTKGRPQVILAPA